MTKFYINAGHGILAKTGWAKIEDGKIVDSFAPFSAHEAGFKLLAEGATCAQVEGELLLAENGNDTFEVSVYEGE